MDVYIPLALILAFICKIVDKDYQKAETFFFVAFIAAFFFAALRYEFGPDYFSYRETFFALKDYGVRDYQFYLNDRTEALFLYYLSLYPYYTLFIFVLSLCWFGCYYVFYKKSVDYRYYWFVLLYMFFDVNCILNNLVAMRTAMVGFLFLIAFMYLIKGQRIVFALIIVGSSFIHQSGIVLLLLLLLNDSDKSILFKKKFIFIVVIGGVASLVMGRNQLLANMSSAFIDLNSDFERYSTYITRIDSTNSGLVAMIKAFVLVVLNAVPVCFLIFYAPNETSPVYRLMLKIGIISSFCCMLFGNTLLGRYFMILNPVYIVGVVRLFRYANKRYTTLAMLSILIVSIYTFVNYLDAEYSISFLKYHTILSAPVIP